MRLFNRDADGIVSLAWLPGDNGTRLLYFRPTDGSPWFVIISLRGIWTIDRHGVHRGVEIPKAAAS